MMSADTPGHRLASRSERLLGQFLDGLAALGAPILLGAVGNAVGGESGIVPGMLAGTLVFALYILFADGLPGGQSLGKRTLRLAVLEAESGRACSFWRSFVRNFTLALLGPIDWVFIFGREHRRLGDYLAGTIVVKHAWSPAAAPARSRPAAGSGTEPAP